MSKDSGNAQGLGGDNKIQPLGTAKASSNEWLGIDKRVADGTTGSRPDSSSKIGGERKSGMFFVGGSAAKDSKELNSGGGAKSSKSAGEYGPGGKVDSGTVGSREQMTIGGDKNMGKLVGQGAGSTKVISGSDQLVKGMKTQAGVDPLKGSSGSQENLAKSMRGIGGKGNKRA